VKLTKSVVLFIMVLMFVVVSVFITSADDYEFILPGGDMILRDVVENYELDDSLSEILSWDLEYEEWREYFESQEVNDGNIIDALKEDVEELEYLGIDRKSETLLWYLTVNLPLAEEDISDDINEANLPVSGRELTLSECGVCHGQGINFTRNYNFNRWVVLLESRDHRGLLGPQEAVEMARYLAINEPIPDLVPASWLEDLPGY